MENYNEIISSIESFLYKNFTAADEYQKRVYESMTYSLSSGGKRVRPILAVLTYKMFGKDDYDKVLPFAAAVEMIHTYSLIHDDLPAMDNDDIRRGKPTNHKVYSEAIAILAGDGLLNMAMEVLSREIENCVDIEDMKRSAKAARYIFAASGVHGMIGGQVIDIQYYKDMTVDMCESMYKLKTAALLRAPIIAAAILAGADDDEIAVLEEYANCIGIAYQIEDDILDYDKDIENHENSLARFMTVEELEERVKVFTERAQNELNMLEYNTEELAYFANILMNRGK